MRSAGDPHGGFVLARSPRIDLEDLLLRVWAENGLTVVFITHDIDESVYLGGRAVVLNPSPTSVRLEVPVPLPVPRDQISSKALPEFGQVRNRVLQEIRRSGPKVADQAAASHR